MTPIKSSKVENLKMSTVKPFEKTQHLDRLGASLFDLVYIDACMPILFLYRPEEGEGSSYSQRVSHLKESLSKVLVPYFPFAGRWVRTYDSRIRELLCNDEGVPFFEARINDDMDSVVGDFDHFRANPLLGGLYLMNLDDTAFGQDVESPLPALFVQATEFKCGSIALYVCFCHQTTDGTGFFDFMAAWSEEAMRGQLSVVPLHDRSSITTLPEFFGGVFATTSSSEPKTFSPEESSKTIDNDSTTNRHSTPKIDLGAYLRNPEEVPIENYMLHVKREAVQDLKTQAIEENSNPDDYVTTVDCIASHLWRCLNSLELTKPCPEGSTEVGSKEATGSCPFLLSHEVEGRRRFHMPPLPLEYTGNCVLPFMIPRIPPMELVNKTHLSVARIIHKCVQDISPSTWKAAYGDALRVLSTWTTRDFRHLLVTSWFRFPMYAIEFRHGLGKPCFVAMNLHGKAVPEGACIILPPRPGSNAIATLQFYITGHILKALLANQNFMSFFHS